MPSDNEQPSTPSAGIVRREFFDDQFAELADAKRSDEELQEAMPQFEMTIADKARNLHDLLDKFIQPDGDLPRGQVTIPDRSQPFPLTQGRLKISDTARYAGLIPTGLRIVRVRCYVRQPRAMFFTSDTAKYYDISCFAMGKRSSEADPNLDRLVEDPRASWAGDQSLWLGARIAPNDDTPIQSASELPLKDVKSLAKGAKFRNPNDMTWAKYDPSFRREFQLNPDALADFREALPAINEALRSVTDATLKRVRPVVEAESPSTIEKLSREFDSV